MKLLFYMTKASRQKFEYLSTKELTYTFNWVDSVIVLKNRATQRLVYIFFELLSKFSQIFAEN